MFAPILRPLAAALFGLAAVTSAGQALAQASTPRLIKEAEFGDIRELTGARIDIVRPATTCSAKGSTPVSTACFDRLLTRAAQGPVRAIAFARPVAAGDRVSGIYGMDYWLYDVRVSADGPRITQLRFETSQLRSPQACYRLTGEAVSYTISADSTALESLLVACGGGPERPNGPYAPVGSAMSSEQLGPDASHIIERVELSSLPRFLAYPGVACDKAYVVRKDWCAREAISWLIANPAEKEVDLIAAKHPVAVGDPLSESEIDQWVLKRRGRNFKADGRWFDRSNLVGEAGCSRIEDVRWVVASGGDGLRIAEKAMASCGPGPAPVPTETFEAYGRDYFIVDCAQDRRGWRDRPQTGSCLDQAADYLRRTGQKSSTVVVVNQYVRLDDYLYPGSYVSYDVADISLDRDGKFEARRVDGFTPYEVYMSGCQASPNIPSEGAGFVIVRSMGVNWARSYRWMDCPVY